MAVCAEGVVGDVEEAVLDAPVAAAEGQHPLGTGLRGVQAGDQVADPMADLARGQMPHFAKRRFPGREGLRTAMIATLIMPPVTFLVPSYVMMANLGLIDTSLPVVLLWAATSVPGNVFLLSALMRSIPSEVLEAARIDGAGYVETLLRIVLPLSVPGIVTVMIFNITAWWNDLLIPLVFIGQEANTTVTAAAATLGSRFSMDYPLVLTGLLLASLPPLAAYIVLQRYIRRRLVLGAVK